MSVSGLLCCCINVHARNETFGTFRESSLKKLKKVSLYDNILYCNHILKL